jgi:hypothetical protein
MEEKQQAKFPPEKKKQQAKNINKQKTYSEEPYICVEGNRKKNGK